MLHVLNTQYKLALNFVENNDKKYIDQAMSWLDQGADPNQKNDAGKTLLELLEKTNKNGCNNNHIEKLLEKNKNSMKVSILDSNGNSILINNKLLEKKAFQQCQQHIANAITHNHQTVLKDIYNLNPAYFKNEAVLKFAIKQSAACLQLFMKFALQESKAGNDKLKSMLQDILHDAVKNAIKKQDLESIKNLAIAAPNFTFSKLSLSDRLFFNSFLQDGLTFIHLVVTDTKVLQTILENLPSQENYSAAKAVNLVDEKNRTPLHYAARFGDKEAIECLLKNGANIEATTEKYNTPLLSIFIDEDDSDKMDKQETTAERNIKKEKVKIFLRAGADINRKKYYGKDLLSFPLGEEAVREYIIELINKQNNQELEKLFKQVLTLAIKPFNNKNDTAIEWAAKKDVALLKIIIKEISNKEGGLALAYFWKWKNSSLLKQATTAGNFETFTYLFDTEKKFQINLNAKKEHLEHFGGDFITRCNKLIQDTQNIKIIDKLLEEGVSVNYVSSTKGAISNAEYLVNLDPKYIWRLRNEIECKTEDGKKLENNAKLLFKLGKLIADNYEKNNNNHLAGDSLYFFEKALLVANKQLKEEIITEIKKGRFKDEIKAKGLIEQHIEKKVNEFTELKFKSEEKTDLIEEFRYVKKQIKFLEENKSENIMSKIFGEFKPKINQQEEDYNQIINTGLKLALEIFNRSKDSAIKKEANKFIIKYLKNYKRKEDNELDYIPPTPSAPLDETPTPGFFMESQFYPESIQANTGSHVVNSQVAQSTKVEPQFENQKQPEVEQVLPVTNKHEMEISPVVVSLPEEKKEPLVIQASSVENAQLLQTLDVEILQKEEKKDEKKTAEQISTEVTSQQQVLPQSPAAVSAIVVSDHPEQPEQKMSKEDLVEQSHNLPPVPLGISSENKEIAEIPQTSIPSLKDGLLNHMLFGSSPKQPDLMEQLNNLPPAPDLLSEADVEVNTEKNTEENNKVKPRKLVRG